MALIIKSRSFSVPFKDQVLDGNGFLSFAWEKFFQVLYKVVNPLGEELSFALKNNQTTALNVDGLQFDSAETNQVIVDYLIQIITGGPGGTELIESGTFHLVYKPKSLAWALVKMPGSGPSTSGITFSVTSNGQVQYTSSNVGGSKIYIYKVTYRARTLSAKLNTPVGGYV